MKARTTSVLGTSADDLTSGTGLTTGTGTVCKAVAQKVGSLYKTTILVDLTGLNDGGTAADIIGVDGGAANCYLAQMSASLTGTIFFGSVTCLELPAGGDPDIDLWTADEGTGVQDTAITALTNDDQLIDHGADWAAGDVDGLTAFPSDGQYLYLACGTCTGADYTAGQFIIELWGA